MADTTSGNVFQEDNYDASKTTEDEVLAQLEDSLDEGFDMGTFREQRLEQLKREMNQLKEMQEQSHDVLTEVTDEKEVVRISAYDNINQRHEKLCVIHFYHHDFKRCQTMNKHLEIIAPRYLKTRFLRVFVENIPWLVERLAIKILPCVICFVDGIAKDRLIGFEELGNSDEFQTTALEQRLQKSGRIGVIQKAQQAFHSLSSKQLVQGERDDDDSDLDIY